MGFIPKILYKVFLVLRDKFDPKPPISEEEKLTVTICKRLLEDKTSKLTLAPVSDKRFIKNESKGMYIILHDHTINLVNHVYSYSIYLTNTNEFRELTNKFDQILDNERIALENEIKNNIQHSLEEILKKLD